METIVCKNIFCSEEEKERNQTFNEIWQRVVNLIENG